MDIITAFISFVCIVICLLAFFKPARKLLLNLVKDTDKHRIDEIRQRKLAARYKQTTLWREVLRFLDDQTLDANLNFQAIEDRFESYEELSEAIKKAGLASCNLIIGVDFTASNEWQGRKTFEHKSLHHIFKNVRRVNPYQRVISAMAETLSTFDEDNLIPCYGFGDKITKDRGVFPFTEDGSPCKGFEHVLQLYNDVVQKTELSGPTSFSPIIREAIKITEQKGGYHILLIIADGQVIEEQDIETRKAIVDASSFPLSIILVGVGDGPWDVMAEYDSHLPRRKFDNFQFVDYNKVTKKAKNPGLAFALNALMEIPDQYNAIQDAGLLFR
eukprot:Seg6222.2 transcript_id=Seg6222.2/GoldUCD/mRNA.D3Y31 product="E3 ubiquitin-protein ligase RGLG5" protein_id=Seg6222.2/GoldUCD/D3Y31